MPEVHASLMVTRHFVKVMTAILLAYACLQQYTYWHFRERVLSLDEELIVNFDVPMRAVTNQKDSNEREDVDCMNVRGKYGEWVENYDYAAQVQYTPLVGFRQELWNRNNPPQKQGNRTMFLPQAVHAWRETRYPQCQIQVMTKDGLCSILETLNIRNVYMAGDSMMHEMWMSFIGILGLTHDLVKENIIACSDIFSFRLYFDRTVLLSIPPPPENSSVNIDKWGEDSIKVIPGYGQVGISHFPVRPRAERVGTPMKFHKYVANNGACPWIKEYENLDGRTLLVINTGAAYHARETCNLMFDGVIEALDNVAKRNDIVFFRSTSPAHHDCFNTSRYPTVPLSNFNEYTRIAEMSRYSWDLFKFYNEYVETRLKGREARKDVFPLEYMNIFNMTALRHDGHRAANDCLHYELPAAVDWWNHLLYTNLLDIADRESKAKQLSEQEVHGGYMLAR